jgi:PhzF family phenazine biosynthesis protein
MKMYQVDAFTQALFKGNPAAVIVVDEWLDQNLMQNIALENNLSETAFVKNKMMLIMKFVGFHQQMRLPFVDMRL